MRHRGCHRVERTSLRQQSLVGRSEMISSRMTPGRSLMRSTGDSIGSSDPGGGLAASPRATGCGIYNRRRRWREPHLLGAGASRLHFPCGRRAELTGLSRVARDEPSGSASGEEGGLGISVGVEEEEQAFSVRVRKKVSGVFWTSEEDWGAGGIGWGDERGRARCSCL